METADLLDRRTERRAFPVVQHILEGAERGFRQSRGRQRLLFPQTIQTSHERLKRTAPFDEQAAVVGVVRDQDLASPGREPVVACGHRLCQTPGELVLEFRSEETRRDELVTEQSFVDTGAR